MIRETLEYVCQGLDMTQQRAYKTMMEIMNGDWTASQIAGFLIALKMKGETVSEISGFVKAMREKATKIKAPQNAVDVVGTGGDGLHTINISTAAALVTSAAGIPVAKHGNRSVSSKAGSADVLSSLGVKIDISPDQAEQCLQEIGFAFLFAPVYHASMKHAITPRKEMGVRTVFNILGPMSNPAMVTGQLVGAFNIEVAEKMVKVLKQTGSDHVLVVHSHDGMDEISPGSKTHVYELKDGEIGDYDITPEQFGMNRIDIDDIKGGEADQNAAFLKELFAGKVNPMTNFACLNAGAAIYIGGKADSLESGVTVAKDLLASGRVMDKLQQLVDFTNSVN